MVERKAKLYCIAIHPAETHPEVILYAVASRDLAKAQKEAKQYNFTKAYGSYQELLDDPEVDMVYISTPNGLHYEWASKALKAGKHVLCEKPFTSNAAEAKKLVQEARERGLVLEEAVSHSSFYINRTMSLSVNILKIRLTSQLLVSLAIPPRRSSLPPNSRFRSIWQDPTYRRRYDC